MLAGYKKNKEKKTLKSTLGKYVMDSSAVTNTAFNHLSAVNIDRLNKRGNVLSYLEPNYKLKTFYKKHAPMN